MILASGSGEGYAPPGPADFDLPPFIPGVEGVLAEVITKPMLLMFASVVLIAAFFMLAIRKQQMVPGRLQFAGEQGYGFVRNTLGRDVIGSDTFLKFVPFLVTLFFFILINNYFGLVPFIQFPTMSIVAIPYALAGVVWVVYNYVGIKQHGFLGYLKHQTIPPGVPIYVLPTLVLIEFMSNIVVRPITLSLRLFANMFAGHLLLLVFVLGGEYLLVTQPEALLKPVGLFAFVMAIAISFLELVVMSLQAFIFTILTAQYIGSALAEEH